MAGIKAAANFANERESRTEIGFAYFALIRGNLASSACITGNLRRCLSFRAHTQNSFQIIRMHSVQHRVFAIDVALRHQRCQ